MVTVWLQSLYCHQLDRRRNCCLPSLCNITLTSGGRSVFSLLDDLYERLVPGEERQVRRHTFPHGDGK